MERLTAVSECRSWKEGQAMTPTGLFNKLRTGQPRIAKRVIKVVVMTMVGTFAICSVVGIRINGSPSLPVGLYLVTAHSHTNLVEFCLTGRLAQLASARGYRDAGSCSDGGAPLLKPVVARAGDTVEVSAAGLAVNGYLLPNTAPMKRDTNNRPLTAWPQGRYTVARDSLWVASSYNARSFDSRYFGPVPLASIRNYVRPWITLP
jgi:conjugative transfer signal peptidase TraF